MSIVEEVTSASVGDIILVKGTAEGHAHISKKVLSRMLAEKKTAGVYVTINKPFDHVSSQLEKGGVVVDKLFFIDAVTRIVLASPGDAQNCLYTTSPKHLQEISVALSKIAVKNPSVRFLVFDSLSTLLVYNDLASVKKFVHFLVTALRQLRMVGVLFALDKPPSELIEFTEALSDKSVVLGGAE